MKPPDDLIIWATICSASGGQPREPSARQRQKLPDGDSRRRSGGARTRCRAPQTSPCTTCRRSPGRCPSTTTRESGRLISFLVQVGKKPTQNGPGRRNPSGSCSWSTCTEATYSQSPSERRLRKVDDAAIADTRERGKSLKSAFPSLPNSAPAFKALPAPLLGVFTTSGQVRGAALKAPRQSTENLRLLSWKRHR